MSSRPRHRAPASIGAAALVIALAGCSGGGTPESVCTDAIAERMGAVFTDVKVTENIETPVAADIQGTYAGGGGFACGLSLHPLALEQALVFPFDGPTITVEP
ncbi:hypothetical protein E3T37_15145 [Cryobacterium sp. TMT2-10]|uniref:hypothetical protein n=1 Tax=Cryobacterium sp. TMT2-10 TaxID=1259244 RepID=UPI00106BDA01|nr:hypothetical protein [Cryobacterium sp. TMT2-10]TFD35649.1 hypothetical protein E3T37_15145 [Cryobacterium sp. TMT2-10]